MFWVLKRTVKTFFLLHTLNLKLCNSNEHFLTEKKQLCLCSPILIKIVGKKSKRLYDQNYS